MVAGTKIAARIVLAAVGGYGVAALATALLSLTLPLARPEAVTTATTVSFSIVAGVVLLVFATRTLLRATAIVLAMALVLAVALWMAAGFLLIGPRP